MHFSHSPDIWSRFPALVAGVFRVDQVRPDSDVRSACSAQLATALTRLDTLQEGEWPSIQAWRRGFSAMGLKPTQYRCAAEALLRRLRKERDLPSLHPLVDLCNAVSAAYGLPIAAFDLAGIQGNLTVRSATGAESHLEFSGALEHPEPGEVVFADDAGRTHARRWCHRQSAASVITSSTKSALIVVEALHDTAQVDVGSAAQLLIQRLSEAGIQAGTALKLLTQADSTYEFSSL